MKTRIGIGGETGIRTLGGFPLNGFQDRRYRPLSHLSVGKDIKNFLNYQMNFLDRDKIC